MATDDLRKPRPKTKTKRYKPRQRFPAYLKPDTGPADDAVCQFMQRLGVLCDRYPAHAGLAMQDLADYLARLPRRLTYWDLAYYCFEHIETLPSKTQSFILSMVEYAEAGKGMTEKQQEYLADVYERLLKQNQRNR